MTRSMLRPRDFPKAFLVAILLSGLIQGATPGAAKAASSILFSDNFEDGIVNTSVFEPLGNAILREVDGKLVITVFANEDGVKIRAPEGAACFKVSQEINRDEFDVRESIVFSTNFLDPDTGESFTGFEATMLRPFWNFCQYDVTGKDAPTGTLKIYCGRKLSTKEECPTVKNIRLDWLPPATEGGPERFVYEVNEGGKWVSGKARESQLKHKDNKITDYTIKFKQINPDFSTS